MDDTFTSAMTQRVKPVTLCGYEQKMSVFLTKKGLWNRNFSSGEFYWQQ